MCDTNRGIGRCEERRTWRRERSSSCDNLSEV